jgi:2-oxoglutarate dehydrogenase E1 component
VIDDPRSDKQRIKRLVLCSGKVYYDISGHELRSGAETVAVARIEQLYPFPKAELAALVASYPFLLEVVWAQEEPQNMGAWRSIRHRLEEALPRGVPPATWAGRGVRAPARATRRPTCASRPDRPQALG